MNTLPTGRCPNIVKGYFSDEMACGYKGYKLLERGVFTKASGFDPLALKVQCRQCEHIYYIFPTLSLFDKST